MAALNLNKVILAGRLVADPEIRSTQDGTKVANIRIAVNRRFSGKDGNKSTDFFTCVAWRKDAELLEKYFKKGSSILIIGEIQNREWEKDGVKHYTTEIMVTEVNFVDSKNDATAPAVDPSMPEPPADLASPAPAKGAKSAPTPPKFEEIGQGDELPF